MTVDANRYGYRAVRLKGADVLEYRPEHYESFQRQETFRTLSMSLSKVDQNLEAVRC